MFEKRGHFGTCSIRAAREWFSTDYPRPAFCYSDGFSLVEYQVAWRKFLADLHEEGLITERSRKKWGEHAP